MCPGGEGWGPAFLFDSLYINLHPDPVSGNRGRHLRTPPTQPGGLAAGAGLRRTRSRAGIRCEAAASVGYAHAPGGEATMAGRGAWRHEMAGRGAWRQSRHRRLPRLCSDAVPHRLAMRRRFLLLPSPSGRRWRRRRHRTCMHRRARWRAPPWGTQKRTRHRRITTESSTSGGFHRRRRRRCRLRGRHAAGRGTTLGAGCAAQRAASAPSPPHLHSTRARSAPSCCGHELARLRVRAQLLRSARASRRAAKGAGRSMANGEMVGEQRRLEPAAAGRGDARVRACARAKKRLDARRTN
jgi:hypothetical protein